METTNKTPSRAICPSCHCNVEVRARWKWEIDAGEAPGLAFAGHRTPGSIQHNPDGSLKFEGVRCPGSNVTVPRVDAAVTQDDNDAFDKLAAAYPDVAALPGPIQDGIVQALANHRKEVK